MLKHSLSCVELGCHIAGEGGKKSDARRAIRSSSRERWLITGPTRDNSFLSENGAASRSTGSSFSREINQNISNVSSVVSSDIDRWLSSEVLAPLASREDSKLTDEIRKSRSFCYGEFQNFYFGSESESRPVSCEFVIGQDTKEEEFLIGKGLIGLSKEGVTEFNDNKSTIEENSNAFDKNQIEHKRQLDHCGETQIDELLQSLKFEIQGNSLKEFRDKSYDLIDKLEPSVEQQPADEEPDEKHLSDLLDLNEKCEPGNQQIDAHSVSEKYCLDDYTEPEKPKPDQKQEPDKREEPDKRQEVDKPQFDEEPDSDKPELEKKLELEKPEPDKKQEPDKRQEIYKLELDEELDSDKVESENRLEFEKPKQYEKQESDKRQEIFKLELNAELESDKLESEKRLKLEKPESLENLDPNEPEPEEEQEIDKSKSVDNQELGKIEPGTLEQDKLESENKQSPFKSIQVENQEQDKVESDSFLKLKEGQELEKLEPNQLESCKPEPDKLQFDNYRLEERQKLDKLEPEQIHEPCKLEPGGKLEPNWQQDQKILEVDNLEQVKRQDADKLKSGENQETDFVQSNINQALPNQELIHPKELDSRNCALITKSLKCLSFQTQTKSGAGDEEGATFNTEFEGEYIAVDRKCDTSSAEKKLKDNANIDKEEITTDEREENIITDKFEEYRKDNRVEENINIFKREQDILNIDKSQEESSIERGEEGRAKLDREQEDNIVSIYKWEENKRIDKFEEDINKDKSEKESASFERLKEIEIPDGFPCSQDKTGLDRVPQYLEKSSTYCSSVTEELILTQNAEKECFPHIRHKNPQAHKLRQGSLQNTDTDSDQCDFLLEDSAEPSENPIQSTGEQRSSETIETFGVGAKDHIQKVDHTESKVEEFCGSKRSLNDETTDVEANSIFKKNNQKEGLEFLEYSVMEGHNNENLPSETVHKSMEDNAKEQNSNHSCSSFPSENEQRYATQAKNEDVDSKLSDMKRKENAPNTKRRNLIKYSSNFNEGDKGVGGTEYLPVKETSITGRNEIGTDEIKQEETVDDRPKTESRSRKQSLPDAMFRSQGKKSKQFKRMNSDSAVMYEKSRYSLGILLEEINDLVRRTSSFECSDLDIRYKPTTDKENHRELNSPQQSVGKGKPSEKAASGEENLLQLVEMYGDKQGKKPVDDKSSPVSKTNAGNSPVEMLDDCGDSKPRGAKAQSRIIMDDLDSFIGVSNKSNKLNKSTVGENNSEMRRKAFYREKPMNENTIQSNDNKKEENLMDKDGSDDRNCVTVSQLSPQNNELSDGNKAPEMKSSMVSKREQRKRFPLRMLRRKSSVASLSILDVHEVTDSSSTGEGVVSASTRTEDSQRRRKYSVVGCNDLELGGGPLYPGGERGTERPVWKGESRQYSGTNSGRSGDGFSVAQSRRQSHQRNSSGSFPSFDVSGTTKTSKSFSETKGSSSTGRNPSLDNRCQKEESISHFSRRESFLNEPSDFTQSSQREKSETRKNASSKNYHRSDRSREESLGTRHEKNLQDRSLKYQEHSKVMGGEKGHIPLPKNLPSSYYQKHSSATDGGGKEEFPHSKTISTEGYSAFNKVGARGEKNFEKSRLTQYNQKLKDGPLSLHESTIMMNSDSGQSPNKSGSQSMEDPSQNPTEQMNGQINYDELCNVKNLKDDEVLPRISEIVQALRGLDEYDRGETMKILKSIGDTYWSYRASRAKIGNTLAEEGFAEITMKILKTLNGKGIFKNDSIWFPVYYCFNTLWNYSDASLKLAKSIAENDGVRFFTINCDHEPYIKNLHSKNVYYVVKASMSILHNISRTTDIHHHFKDNGTTEVMLKFATWKDLNYEMLKVMSLLTLAHIVEEEENDKLIDETGAIDSCMKYIRKALGSEKRRHLGFTPHELMDGMSKLAVNDKNKKKIVDAGALPVFLDMLKGNHTEEQAIVARAIWTLSFDKEVCQQIVEFPEMMEKLEALRTSQDKEVVKNVNGALFVLKGENDVSKRPKSGKKNKGHVFISYSWNEKEVVMKLRERLKKEGVEVWIDVERMGGSTLAAMAEAVENAAVVLICMSEKYKQSPNCRLEAEYTFQMRKEYIPLMVQKRYRPDGWLGMILGAKLYFDFSGKYPFEKPWNGLMKELKGMGRLSVLDNNALDKTDAPVASSSPAMLSSQPIRQSSISSKLYQMNTEDVSNWLCSLKLDGCVPSFAQFDGKLLAQLKSMKSEAAEFYYHCLEKNLNMNLVEILTFTEGLEKL